MNTKTILEIAGLGLLAMLLYQNCNTNHGNNSYAPKAEAVAYKAASKWFPHAQSLSSAEGYKSVFANAATNSFSDFQQWRRVDNECAWLLYR